LSIAEFNVWWDAMRRLDKNIRMLEQTRNQLKDHIEDINTQLIPTVKWFVDYWGQQQDGKRPSFYKKVVICRDKWQQEYPNCESETVDELLSSLFPGWRDSLPSQV
jgi:D-Tyr-tRNAtyr deacylase